MAIPATHEEGRRFFSIDAGKGVANTVGTAPLTPAQAQVALQNLRNGAYPITWWQNYAVTPWGQLGFPNYGVPMTDPGPDTTTLPIPSGLKFVPSLLGPAHVNAQELTWCQPWAAKAGYVITFNEPNNNGTTTDQAIALWPQIQAMADAAGALIVAPSVGWDVGGQNWINDFMTKIAANGYRVDVMNFHETLGSFDDSTGIPGQLVTFFQHLDGMHATFPTKKILITEWEFYCTAQDRFKQFLDGVRPGIVSRPWVIGSAIWPMGTDPTKTGGAGVDTLSLANVDGSLTTSGTQYVSQL